MFRSYCDVALASPSSAIAIFAAISSCVSASILAAYACPATGGADVGLHSCASSYEGSATQHPGGPPFADSTRLARASAQELRERVSNSQRRPAFVRPEPGAVIGTAPSEVDPGGAQPLRSRPGDCGSSSAVSRAWWRYQTAARVRKPSWVRTLGAGRRGRTLPSGLRRIREPCAASRASGVWPRSAKQ